MNISIIVQINVFWLLPLSNSMTISNAIQISIYDGRRWEAISAGFTYKFDRLKPRASQFRGPPVKVYNIFNTVIGLSHLCCHNVLYLLSNPSVVFLTQLHSISEYCRILSTRHHLCIYWNWLSTLPCSSIREGGEVGGASQVD